jgi:hypothetical protein
MLKSRGYTFKDGYIWNGNNKVTIDQEEDLFKRAGMEFVTPDKRT